MKFNTTTNSTIKGKAYEYACILAVKQIVSNIRPLEIINNSSLKIAKRRFLNDITESERIDMLASAKAGIDTIIDMEPRIIEDDNDKLTVLLQPDTVAVNGDVRDMLIIRRRIKWEIGISVKHNHEALKHSRLADNLDFGSMWYGVPSSAQYFNDISPIFNFLKELKTKMVLWRKVDNKEGIVYIPLLKAFMKELKRAYVSEGKKVTTGLIKYLLGSDGNDYYKLIHYNNHTTRIVPYNLYGTLNRSSSLSKPNRTILNTEFPSDIVDLSLKKDSQTTVILTMNKGWSISFRIHNASSTVEPSLKFDIQLVGQPSSLFFIDVDW